MISWSKGKIGADHFGSEVDIELFQGFLGYTTAVLTEGKGIGPTVQ